MNAVENNVRPADANETLSNTDVMRVVRCKNCKFRTSSEFCECRDDDAFCSDGEAIDGTVPEMVSPEPLNGHALHLINDLYAQIEDLKQHNSALRHTILAKAGK